MRCFLDTHAVVLLAAGDVAAFGPQSRRLMERELLQWTPIVRLELALLFEIGRIVLAPGEVLATVHRVWGGEEDDTPQGVLMARAAELGWTRDPFDRVITAAALVNGLPLITRDRRIAEHCRLAVW